VILPKASQAGTIYTTRAAYDAAVVGLTLSWSEDFEGFAQGQTAVPTVIGGGSAEIAKSGGATIVFTGQTLPPIGSNEWAALEPGFGETIQGLGGASLAVHAMGFDYVSQLAGSYNFHHSGGVDSDASKPSFTGLFVGWVGSSGEVLDFVDYTPGTSAHTLDDIVAHVVPEPSTAFLFASGLVGLAVRGRRRQT
jgi:hypothetical protein